jgi:hypothetical protein
MSSAYCFTARPVHAASTIAASSRICANPSSPLTGTSFPDATASTNPFTDNPNDSSYEHAFNSAIRSATLPNPATPFKFARVARSTTKASSDPYSANDQKFRSSGTSADPDIVATNPG